MQILDSCTKNEQNAVPFYHERRGGIRVEDLINRFKSESKFDTMNKAKQQAQSNGTGQRNETTANTHTNNTWADVDQIDLNSKISLHSKECEMNSRSNDLYSTNNDNSEDKIQIVKVSNET